VGTRKAEPFQSCPHRPYRPHTEKHGPAPTVDPGRCRRCGEPIEDRRPNWLAFADGSAAHVRCEDEREIARVQRAAFSPDAMRDPAELTIKGVPLP
jgi:hypothetical protein